MKSKNISWKESGIKANRFLMIKFKKDEYENADAYFPDAGDSIRQSG